MESIPLTSAAALLLEGKVGVIPTDTLYGLVACAGNPLAVQRIYQIKKRQPQKPFIILISSPDELASFNIAEPKIAIATTYWPGPISLVLPLKSPYLEQWKYLHAGENSLAFRCPADLELSKLLKQTGPLIAPSANPESLPPARSVVEAQAYFGRDVDFYVDGDMLDGKASQLISLLADKPERLR